MHRHTPCMGVGGVKGSFRACHRAPGELEGLIHQRDSTGNLHTFAHGGDPLLYCPRIAHPPTKVTLKLT